MSRLLFDVNDVLVEAIGPADTFLRPLHPEIWQEHDVVALGWPPANGGQAYELLLVHHPEHETERIEVTRGWADTVPRIHLAFTPMKLLGTASIRPPRRFD